MRAALGGVGLEQPVQPDRLQQTFAGVLEAASARGMKVAVNRPFGMGRMLYENRELSKVDAGTAVAVSTVELVAKAREKAAQILEASVEDIEYRDGMLTVVGTDKRIGLFEIAKKETGAKLSVDSTGEVDGPSWPNGTHICEVEIDPETGVSKVVRYTTVDDVGGGGRLPGPPARIRLRSRGVTRVPAAFSVKLGKVLELS